MKRYLIALTIGTIATTGVALASQLPLKYRQVYCYPTGTYWVKQLTRYPAYYATNNAYYVTNYGAATQYCPNI